MGNFQSLCKTKDTAGAKKSSLLTDKN